MPFHRHYAQALFAHLPPVIRHIARLYYLGNLRFHFDLHEQCLESPQAWPMPCTAGETSIVIDHNGRFRACEMRGIVGDLHDFDFDVRRALDSSDAMRGEVDAIPESQLLVHPQLLHSGQLEVLVPGAVAADSCGGPPGRRLTARAQPTILSL